MINSKKTINFNVNVLRGKQVKMAIAVVQSLLEKNAIILSATKMVASDQYFRYLQKYFVKNVTFLWLNTEYTHGMNFIVTWHTVTIRRSSHPCLLLGFKFF